MKIKLPIIGDVRTGKDAELNVKEVIKEVEARTKSVTGGFLDFSNKPLTDDLSVSSKVLEANVGWVYKNNDVIAKEVADIELELYKVRTVRDEVIFDRIYTHPILDALARFNDYTSQYDGFYTTQSHRKLAGDAFWYVDRTGININSITILPPDKVKINLGKVEGSRRVIQSYTYKDTIKGEDIEITYDPEEIIHFKVPNPKNFYRGKSAVEAAADAIDLDTYAIEANKQLFRRGLIAELMLTTDKSLTPEQIKQLHAEMKSTYSGVQNAYKIPIFSGGIKPESVQMTNKDAQFIEQQSWLRDKICSIFGNPKSIITTDDVNRANADATILNWKRGTITNEMKGIVNTLNEFLVPLYGDNLLLGFEDPVEEDLSQKITDVKALVGSDIITINEAREEIGREPVDGGDEMSFQRTERRIQESPNVPPALRHVRIDRVVNKYVEKAQEFIQAKEAAKKYASRYVKAKKGEKYFKSDDIQSYYDKQINIVNTVEEIFRDKVSSFVNKIVDKALANVPNEVANMQKKQLLNEEELVVEATIDFTPILLQAATQSGVNALSLINLDTPYIPVNIEKLVTDRVKMFATSMIDTDRDKLIDIITQGVANGESVPQISQGIRETFATFAKTQTDRIVRTEVLRVSNIAAVDAWEQTGIVVAKQWLVSPGADAECKKYDGKVVKLKADFYDTDKWADGNPPIHPNCRCTLLPVLKGESPTKAEVVNIQNEARIKDLEAYVKELEEFINE